MLSACFGDVSYLEQELNQLIPWRSCVSVRFWYPFVKDLHDVHEVNKWDAGNDHDRQTNIET